MLWGESCPYQRVVPHLWDSNPPGEASQPIAMWKFNFIYFSQFSSEWSFHRQPASQPQTTRNHASPRQQVPSPGRRNTFLLYAAMESAYRRTYMVWKTGKGSFQNSKTAPICFISLNSSGNPDTNTTATKGRTAAAATHRSEVAEVSPPIVCCLCLSGLLLPWRDKWTPATESSDTIHKDVFEQQNNYLFSQAVGETESGSFESLHWEENPFLGPWQPFLFCQCKKKKKTELKRSFFFYYIGLGRPCISSVGGSDLFLKGRL